jgi:D-amino-acid dehydrogenase
VRQGAKVMRGKVTAINRNAAGAQSMVIGGTTHPVERLLVAAGAGSRALCQAMGFDLPLEAERGYHITLPDPGLMPRVTVTNRDSSFACAPMNMGLRIAGTAEFAGIDSEPDWSRAELLKRQAVRMFPGVRLDNLTRWAGDRPSLPDGLPALGAAPGLDNVYCAFGNGHFGITGGPVMAKVIAEVIAGSKPSLDLSPFRVGRFGSSRA